MSSSHCSVHSSSKDPQPSTSNRPLPFLGEPPSAFWSTHFPAHCNDVFSPSLPSCTFQLPRPVNLLPPSPQTALYPTALRAGQCHQQHPSLIPLLPVLPTHPPSCCLSPNRRCSFSPLCTVDLSFLSAHGLSSVDVSLLSGPQLRI